MKTSKLISLIHDHVLNNEWTLSPLLESMHTYERTLPSGVMPSAYFYLYRAKCRSFTRYQKKPTLPDIVNDDDDDDDISRQILKDIQLADRVVSIESDQSYHYMFGGGEPAPRIKIDTQLFNKPLKKSDPSLYVQLRITQAHALLHCGDLAAVNLHVIGPLSHPRHRQELRRLDDWSHILSLYWLKMGEKTRSVAYAIQIKECYIRQCVLANIMESKGAYAQALDRMDAAYDCEKNIGPREAVYYIKLCGDAPPGGNELARLTEFMCKKLPPELYEMRYFKIIIKRLGIPADIIKQRLHRTGKGKKRKRKKSIQKPLKNKRQKR